MKIKQRKMKGLVHYTHRYGTEVSMRVITGADADGYAIVKVRPHYNESTDWFVPEKSDLLKMMDNGSGYDFEFFPDLVGEQKRITLDYSEAHNMLVAMLADMLAKNHKMSIEWTKTTEDFDKGVKLL